MKAYKEAKMYNWKNRWLLWDITEQRFVICNYTCRSLVGNQSELICKI